MPTVPIDNISSLIIVWLTREKIIRTVVFFSNLSIHSHLSLVLVHIPEFDHSVSDSRWRW